MAKKGSSRVRNGIERRIDAIANVVDRGLAPHPAEESTPEQQHRHLLEEAQELYANELMWEQESGEENTGEGVVVELVFPGTLALVDALVTSHAPGESGEGEPHRDVVFAFAEWLEERLSRLRSGETGGSTTSRAKQVDLTDELIDLVLYRYCQLDDEEIEEVEAARSS